MEHVRMGGTDLHASRIGFGGAAIGGHDYGPVDDDDSIAAVHAALDAGVTLFDVADVYGFGRAERVLGQALASAGPRRHDALIATKVGVRWDESGETRRDLSPAWIFEAVDASLTRLGVERIGIYQIHWPDSGTALDDTMHALRRCQEMGKVAAVGCCNFSASVLRAGAGAGRLETLQLPFSLVERENAASLGIAHELGMTTMVYNALGRGLLTGKFREGAVFSGTDTRRNSHLFDGETGSRGRLVAARLVEIASAHRRTPAQVAIRWALQQPEVDIVLVGAKTAAQVADNAAAIEFTLLPEELAWLDAAPDDTIAGAAEPRP